MTPQTTIKLLKDTRCLVVEDSEARNDWFRLRLTNPIICTDSQAAISELLASDQYGYPFDVVFLDHDCVPRFVESEDFDYRKLTFWAVAERLHRMEYQGTVVIHSGNPVGAKRMADPLISAGVQVFVMPFGMFDIAEAI